MLVQKVSKQIFVVTASNSLTVFQNSFTGTLSNKLQKGMIKNPQHYLKRVATLVVNA